VRRLRRPDTEAAEDADERTVRTAALALLAGREFAREELRDRLLRRGYPEPLVTSAIEQLVSERLVSDERFTEELIRQRSMRGQGPLRIRLELRERNVADGVVDEALASAGIDWGERAHAVRRRRFGAKPPADFRERAKQARFLQYRGFSADQVRVALGDGEEFEQ
jgi:regulatory protein